MQMSEVFAGTPRYVLMDGNHRIGPKVVPLDSGTECLVIYGFSDKGPYDKFLTNSQQPLTPYPLVQGYLRSHGSATGDGLKLVVVDATGPREPCLHAVTMAAVLDAQKNRATHVSAAYRLMFDQETNAYTVEEVSV